MLEVSIVVSGKTGGDGFREVINVASMVLSLISVWKT